MTAAGGTVHWARDAAEANAIVAGIVRGQRRQRGRQGQVDGDPGDRAQRGAPPRRHRRLGDRPRRDDRPARSRPAVAHPGPGDPSQPDRDPGHLPRRDGARRPAGTRGPDRRPARAGRGGPPAPAREVPACPGRGLRRQLRGRRDRHRRRPRVGGQRADVPDAPRGPHHGHGHREARPDLARPRGLPPAAAALVDRRADEPVHDDLDGCDAGRRAAGVPPDPARQRSHRRAVGHGRPPGTPLHPLLGLPQRLPRLRADRRAGLRLGLPGPDRRDPDAAAARHRQAPGRQADRVAAVRVVAVRRVLRRVSGPDRHPRGPRPPAWPGGPPVRGDPPPADRRGAGDGRGGVDAADARGGSAWPSEPRGSAGRVFGRRGGSGGCPGRARSGAGSGPATSRLRRASRSAPGGSAPTADGTGSDGDAARPPRRGRPGRIRAALADGPRAVAVPRDYERALPPARTSASCSSSA